MIEIEGLEGEYFRLQSASISAGELAAVVAPSEPCAREFVDLVLGLEVPRKGAVSVMGRDLGALGEPEKLSVRGTLGFAAQAQGLLGHLSLRENILLGASYHRAWGPEDVDARLRTMLAWYGWPEEGAREAFLRLPEEASPFERSCAAWLRAALGEPDLIFCEDIFEGLGPDERRRIVGASVAYQEESTSRASVFVLLDDRLLEEIQPTAVFYLSRSGDFRAEI